MATNAQRPTYEQTKPQPSAVQWRLNGAAVRKSAGRRCLSWLLSSSRPALALSSRAVLGLLDRGAKRGLSGLTTGRAAANSSVSVGAPVFDSRTPSGERGISRVVSLAFQVQEGVAGAAMTCTLPPPPPPPDPSGDATFVWFPLEPAAEVSHVVPVPAHRPPVAPAAPPMSGAAPPAAGVSPVAEPLVPGFEFEERPREEPEPPPCTRTTLAWANAADTGDASKTPPPLPAPPLPLLVTDVEAPGE
jgi:hypothetical protein